MIFDVMCESNVFLKDDDLLYGYASVFNVKDSQSDVIVSGSFERFDKSKIRFMLEHTNCEIGQIVTINEDLYGIFISARIFSNDLKYSIKQGLSCGLSIGFVSTKEFFDNVTGTNYILSGVLNEISLVKNPANKKAVCFL